MRVRACANGHAPARRTGDIHAIPHTHINTETSTPDSYDTFNTVGLVGVKYFTPYRFNVDVSMDHQLRPRIRLDRELLLFPRFFIEGEYEYRADFGWVNNLENNNNAFYVTFISSFGLIFMSLYLQITFFKSKKTFF